MASNSSNGNSNSNSNTSDVRYERVSDGQDHTLEQRHRKYAPKGPPRCVLALLLTSTFAMGIEYAILMPTVWKVSTTIKPYLLWNHLDTVDVQLGVYCARMLFVFGLCVYLCLIADSSPSYRHLIAHRRH